MFKISFNFKLIFIIIYLLFLVVFFIRLFFPKPSLFYTPDFGRSDIWHFNYPIKDFLSQSLKRGQLPFWSNQVGTGFPLLAEGQIGALNIFNLIIFFIFPIWIAWNLSFILIFFISFLGTFLFLKQNKLSHWASFFGGFVFSFGGFFIAHISHFNLIQASSYLPWLLLTGQNLLTKPSKNFFLFFSLVLVQQFFSGHPQMTFISLVGVALYVLVYYFFSPSHKKRKGILIFIAACIFALLLSAPQILPTMELTKISNRRGGLKSEMIFQYPYPVKHLLTFLIPNYFGSPSNGSYPPFKPGWGIYWENTIYLGILPLLLIFFTILNKKKNLTIKFAWMMFLLSILLVLGKNSPLYFIFTFPIFNYFRTPSRFLLLTSFSISILASYGWDNLFCWLNKRIKSNELLISLSLILILIGIYDLFHFGYNYHPLVTVKEALLQPESAELILPNERIMTDPNQFVSWTNYFSKRGWQDINTYLYFKNGLNEDLNLVFNKTNINAFYGLPSARQEFYQMNINRQLIDAAGTKYFISPKKMDNLPDSKLIKQITAPKNDLPDYYIYKNNSALERFRFASNYLVKKNIKEFFAAMDKDFSFQDTVILEEDIKDNFDKLTTAEIKILKDKNEKIHLETDTDKKSILVIADSFYPGWLAKIDGAKTKILPANLNQRALILPAGKHQVELYYFPKSFYLGMIISIIALLGYGLFYFPRSSKEVV